MSSPGRPETLELQQGKRDEGGLEGLLHVCRVGAGDRRSGVCRPHHTGLLPLFSELCEHSSVHTHYPRPRKCHSEQSGKFRS